MRPELEWFVDQMEAVLKKNDHKQHWSSCDYTYLLNRLIDEEIEVQRCFDNTRHGKRIPACSAGEIIRECCDVANFAMMIADKIRKEALHAE